MSFEAIDAAWWPFLFILLAGWLPTDMWRFLGVYLAGRVREEAEILVFVRALATALVAGVIAKLVLYPEGLLAQTPLVVRVAAMALGFAAFRLAGQRVIVGVLTGEAILIGAMLLAP